MKKNCALTLLLVLFLVLPAWAQLPWFQSYRLLKKTEPVHINRIFQDRDGFIWFGTDGGLFRFDGKNHRRYTVADSLLENNVTAIAQDSLGRIWAGHSNGTISIVSDEKIVAFAPPESTAIRQVSDITFDRKGRLWFSTHNDGLYYYQRNRLYRLDEMEGMPDLFVYDVVEDTNGNVWAGTDGGIVICRSDQDKVTIDVINHHDGLPDNIVKKLIWYGDQLLIATEDAGIISYNPADQSFRPLITRWDYGAVTDMSLHGTALWFTTRRSGLMRLELTGESKKTVSHFQNEPGYTLRDVVTLFHDREGNLWAGTQTGVFRTPGAELQFVGASASSADPNVLAVVADMESNLWFSTPDGLFKRTVRSDGTTLYTRPLATTPYNRYTVISLHCAGDGSLWAGLYGEGLLRIDTRTGEVRSFLKELRNGNVLNITGSRDGLWLATLGGVERVSIQGGEVSFTNYSRATGLSSDFIYQVFVDSRDRAWFATDGRGVDVFEEGRIRHYEDGLPSKVVYGFAEDSLGRIWVNIQSNGLYVLEGDKFVPADLSVPLRSNDINILTTDRKGHIVAVHDLGIDLIDPATGSIRFRGEEYGLRDKIPTLNAVSRDLEGNIYLGTAQGIVLYSPRSGVVEDRPGIFIDRMNVFGEAINLAQTPVLGYNENNVRFDFHGFWFQNANGLQYRYRLDHYDKDWISTSDNTVIFSHLPPGHYVFRVMSSDNEDFSGAAEATVSFTITPPFWTTTPFYIATGIILFVLAYAVIRYRESQLIEDKIILERKVEERTLEIQRKTEEIQAQNEEIMAQAEEIKGINENLEMIVNQRTQELERKNKALEEYAFINAHKLRSPVASILGLVNLISKTEIDDEARVITKHLQQSASELDEIVRSITQAIERGD